MASAIARYVPLRVRSVSTLNALKQSESLPMLSFSPYCCRKSSVCLYTERFVPANQPLRNLQMQIQQKLDSTGFARSLPKPFRTLVLFYCVWFI